MNIVKRFEYLDKTKARIEQMQRMSTVLRGLVKQINSFTNQYVRCAKKEEGMTDKEREDFSNTMQLLENKALLYGMNRFKYKLFRLAYGDSIDDRILYITKFSSDAVKQVMKSRDKMIKELHDVEVLYPSVEQLV